MGKPKQRLPLLLTSHGYHSDEQSLYNLLENRYHTTRIPFLHNMTVLCSAYGWLVLLDCIEGDSQGECCLWNPTSFEIIQLPELDDPLPYTRCFLNKPPTEPDCFIVFNHIFSMNQIVCRIQDNALFELNLLEEAYRLLCIVSFQGMIYAIIQPFRTSKYEFATIHMVGDKLEKKSLLIDGKLPWEVPQPLRSWITTNQNYLIESPCGSGSGLLLLTKMSFNKLSGVHFRVYRVDVGKMECEELENLDGRTVFINSDDNGFCRYSESFGAAIKPNSIYYTDRFGMVIHVYDLDDRSTVTLSLYPDEDVDPNSAQNCWVDLPDIAMKNILYFRVS